MSSKIIDKKTLSKLGKAKDREWHKIYFDEIRPVITSALKSKIEKEKSYEKVPLYKNLVVILGHNANPALIVTQSICAEKTILLFTEKNRKQLEKVFLPTISKEMPDAVIEFLELDYTDHDSNYAKIIGALGSIEDKYSTLCDITGGKKIISTQLGIVASRLGIDICYIDSSDYLVNSATPEPGSESLYIHYSGKEKIHEISLKDENMLVINSINGTTINFNYHVDGELLNFQKSNISSSMLKAIRDDIETGYYKIDHCIECDIDCSENLDELAGLVQSMLIVDDLDIVLRATKDSSLKLVVAPNLAGIPWETLLVRGYGFPIPLISKMIRENKTVFSRSEKKNGILFIKGDGCGIDNFDKAVTGFISTIDSTGQKYNFIEAEDAGVVGRELGRRRYNLIIYYGHSDFDEDEFKTGWRCMNGEIFPCNEFRILRHNAPDMIISNSCNSARAIPFISHSIAYNALRAGARSYIGTRWPLEFGRSGKFISTLIKNMLQKHKSPEESFKAAINFMAKEYGYDDASVYNYIFYN